MDTGGQLQGNRPRLQDFQGNWRLERRIDDRLTGQVSHFDGQARFVPVDGGLDYSETGTLVMPGAAPMQATRRYLWRADGERISILFEDGRPFHGFDPAGGAVLADHWCDPDSYRVCYDFSAWPRWSSRWSVNGPRKDYVMQTGFSPA